MELRRNERRFEEGDSGTQSSAKKGYEPKNFKMTIAESSTPAMGIVSGFRSTSISCEIGLPIVYFLAREEGVSPR